MADTLRWTHFPYCLDRQSDGSYAVLNRRYKPIGMTTGEHVDYMTAPGRVRFKRMGPATARALSFEGSENLDRIYLYDDGSTPDRGPRELAAYLERLGRLMALQIE